MKESIDESALRDKVEELIKYIEENSYIWQNRNESKKIFANIQEEGIRKRHERNLKIARYNYSYICEIKKEMEKIGKSFPKELKQKLIDAGVRKPFEKSLNASSNLPEKQRSGFLEHEEYRIKRIANQIKKLKLRKSVKSHPKELEILEELQNTIKVIEDKIKLACIIELQMLDENVNMEEMFEKLKINDLLTQIDDLERKVILIQNLSLSKRAKWALQRDGIYTVANIISKDLQDLMTIEDIEQDNILDIIGKIHEMGYTLVGEEPDLGVQMMQSVYKIKVKYKEEEIQLGEYKKIRKLVSEKISTIKSENQSSLCRQEKINELLEEGHENFERIGQIDDLMYLKASTDRELKSVKANIQRLEKVNGQLCSEEENLKRKHEETEKQMLR